MSENNCNLGKYRNNNDYDKLVYYLFLSYNNMTEERKDEFYHYFFDLKSRNLFDFASSKWLDPTHRDNHVVIPNVYIISIQEDLIKRLLQFAEHDEEKAVYILSTTPSIMELDGLIEKLNEICLKKITGSRIYKEKERNYLRKRSVFVSDFNLTETEPGTLMHILVLRNIKNELIDSKLENWWNIVDNLAYMSQLVKCGYQEECRNYLKKFNMYLKTIINASENNSYEQGIYFSMWLRCYESYEQIRENSNSPQQETQELEETIYRLGLKIMKMPHYRETSVESEFVKTLTRLEVRIQEDNNSEKDDNIKSEKSEEKKISDSTLEELKKKIERNLELQFFLTHFKENFEIVGEFINKGNMEDAINYLKTMSSLCYRIEIEQCAVTFISNTLLMAMEAFKDLIRKTDQIPTDVISSVVLSFKEVREKLEKTGRDDNFDVPWKYLGFPNRDNIEDAICELELIVKRIQRKAIKQSEYGRAVFITGEPTIIEESDKVLNEAVSEQEIIAGGVQQTDGTN